MKLSICIFLVLAIALSACGSNDTAKLPGSKGTASSIPPSGDSGLNPEQQSNQSLPVNAIPTTSSSTPAANIPLNLKGLTSIGNGASGALNPEHGKPGHRCDIAVGAPLNSTPTTGASSQPKVISTPLAPTGNAGLNPQHGQPGHRCDIPVGAPLNSKPTTATAP